MRISDIDEDGIYQIIDAPGDSSIPEAGQAYDAFQSEVRQLHATLIRDLAPLGKEGSAYGESDFAIRPHPKGLAPRKRQFVITILSESFLRKPWLPVLHRFLCAEAPNFLLLIEQDVDPHWELTILLTESEAKLYCDDADESLGIRKLLEEL